VADWLFSPPLHFLVAAGRIALDRPEAAASVAMCAGDWTSLPQLARRHGMTAWVARCLDTYPDASAETCNAVAADYRAQALEALRGLNEALAAVAVLRDARVPAVALKGPLFALWLYGSAGCRGFRDLDLLIDGRHALRALECLLELGYRLPDGISYATARMIYAGRGAWPLERPGYFPLDVHWRLADIRFTNPLDPGEVIRDAEYLAIAGAGIPIPSATHAAMLTLMHAAKHGWCSLELLLAIAFLIRRPDVDWPAVERICSRRRVGKVSSTGVYLAERLFDVAARARRHPDERARTGILLLRQTAYRNLQMPPGDFPDRWNERRTHHATLDRLADRLRYDALGLVMPTPAEPACCRLPDALVALYAPMRLVRLAVKAFTSALWRVSQSFTNRSSGKDVDECFGELVQPGRKTGAPRGDRADNHRCRCHPGHGKAFGRR
jgi:hypothetical protein